MAVPKGYTLDAAPSLPQGYVLDSSDSSAPSTPDFTTNAKGEGLYAMEDANGKQIPVPFSRVEEAGKSGYRFSNKITIPNAKGREDYAKDRFATLQPAANTESVGDASGILEGRFFKGGKVVPQTPIPEQIEAPPGLWSSLRNSMAKAAVPTGANRPESLSKTHSLIDSAWNAGANLVDDALNAGGTFGNTLFSTADMVPQIYSASSDVLSRDPRRFVKGFRSLMQMMPPAMANNYINHLQAVRDQNPRYALDDVIGTTMGVWAAGKATDKVTNAVTHPVETVKKVVGTPARATLEAVTNTSPRGIREMAEEVQKKNEEARKVAEEKNQKAQQEHEQKKAEAEHATKGKEIAHKYDVHQTAQEQAAKHQQEVADVDAHNSRVWDKTSKEYMQDVKDVRDANQKAIEKYTAEKTRVEEENKAAEHELELRRSEESKLEQQTKDYYAKNDATKAKVKASADAKWQPVHQALDAKTVDGGFIEQPLEKIRKVSPDIQRELSQLIPDPADAEQGSPYVQKRNEILKAMGHKDPQVAYDSMDDFGKANVDRAVASEGFTPEPIDLDPKSGVDIPFDKIHRAQSVIGRNLREGRYGFEGTLRGEMERLQQILYNAENHIAANAGKTSDLNDARQATREYKEAFGIEKNKPLSNDEEMKQRANPEQFKEEQEQKQVDAASKHDPDLAKDYQKVKARREALKKLKTEDQLRKSIQQVPKPPELKPFPVYEPPTIGDLRSGFNLKPKPSLPPAGSALQAVKEPERVSPGPEPTPVPPKTETISPEDYKGRKLENIKSTAKSLRATGLRRGLYATLTGLPFAVKEAFNGMNATGVGEAALGGIAAGGVVLAGSHMLANLLEKPAVKGWISSITPKDIAEFEKLPPEQKEIFTEDMRNLVKTAEDKHIPVSASLKTFVKGAAVSQLGQKPNPKDLMAQAKSLQDSMYNAGLSSKPPEDTTQPAYTHEWNPETNSIVPVQK